MVTASREATTNKLTPETPTMTMTQHRPTETDWNGDPLRSLFVYGTLRPRGSRDVLAYRALSIRRVVLEGWRLFGADHPFPFAVESAGGRVIGDLLTFTADEWGDVLDLCDAIEGYPDFYTRQVVVVTEPSGVLHRAWVYTPTAPHRQRAIDSGAIKSGDWFAR